MQSPQPEEPGTLALLSCCLSAHRHSLLGHPVPARELGHRYLRLTGDARRRPRTLTGFPRSACASCDRGGRPLDPEASGVHTADENSPAAACRSSTARPCTPIFIPSPGALGNEASAGVHLRSPVRSSPRLRSRMERVRFGFFPELRTPQLPTAHVRAGTGLEHWPGAMSPTSRRPSSPQAHSQHATSCRTSSAQSSLHPFREGYLHSSDSWSRQNSSGHEVCAWSNEPERTCRPCHSRTLRGSPRTHMVHTPPSLIRHETQAHSNRKAAGPLN
jgi:hypothetical protein